MPFIHSRQEDDGNLEVYVKVPTPKPPPTKAVTVAIIGAFAVIFAALITRGAIQMNNNSSSTQNSVSTPTSAPTQEQRATALIEQYFYDINNKDYQAAYNIWKDAPDKPSLPNFEKAYASTLNDTVTVNNATVQDNGTVKVFVTLQATDQLPSGTGTKTSVFKGFYIVGTQNGSLRILSGQLN